MSENTEKKPEKKFIISKQVAKDQLNELLDLYEFDEDDLPEELKIGIEYAIRKTIKSIRKGRLEIKDGGRKVIQKLKSGEILEYAQISGKHKMEMKDNYQQHKKIYSLLGAMSSAGAAAISMLEGVDLSTAENIGLIFLQT